MPVIRITVKHGRIHVLATDSFDMSELLGLPMENITFRRVSHVEIINKGPYKGLHLVDVTPLDPKTNGVLWPPFKRRADALAAEHDFVNAFVAGKPVWEWPNYRPISAMTAEEQEHYGLSPTKADAQPAG